MTNKSDLVLLEYSQVELRVLAHLSSDPELLKEFLRNEDMHVRTARSIFGFGPDEPVPTFERACAKAVNFGVLYDQTNPCLSEVEKFEKGENT